MNRHDADAYLEMAEDRQRTAVYRAALRRACPGRDVVDLGCGTGLLSLLALQAGASRVYGIEVDRDALAIAVRAAADNGFADRFVPLQGLSTKVELPAGAPLADVLVAEVFDSTGIGEDGPAFMVDAFSRLCSPDAVVLPLELTCRLCLCRTELLGQAAIRWGQLGAQLDLDLSVNLRAGCGRNARVHPMTRWITWQQLCLGTDRHAPRALVPLTVVEAGAIHGIGSAFDLAFELPGQSIRFTTMPGVDTHWLQGFYPLPVPVQVEVGDRVLVELALASSGFAKLRFGWSIRVYRAGQVPEEKELAEVLESGRARHVRPLEGGGFHLVEVPR